MSKDEFLYKTKFEIKARILNPSKEELNEARASLVDLKPLFPSEIDPETDPDIVYVIGNLAVAGVLNLNDDGLSIEESLSVYKKFEKKQVNLEHDRTQIIGFILKSGLSRFGTDIPITEDEAKSENQPFNITVVIAIWKVAAKELCEFLLDKASDAGESELSLSFEVGFDKYQIIELSGDSVDFNKAQKIIYDTSPEFTSYNLCLKANGGSGKKNGNKIGRSLCGKVIPLGAGMVTVPAANVKGVLPITSKVTETTEDLTANPFAKLPTQPFSVPAKVMKKIKLSTEQIRAFNKIHADNLTVTLKSGKKIKLANYDNGILQVPSDEELEHTDILSIDPSKVADESQIDNSPIVHPHVDQVYPNCNEETQKKNAEFEKQRAELRKKEYKDASGQLLDLINRLNKTAEKHFEQNPLKNGVLKTTTHNKFMNLKEIQAKVAGTEDISTLKECVANAVLFADEIAKKSEELEAALASHNKLMEEALKQKEESERMHAAVTKEFEALKVRLQDMEAAHKASEMESKFHARMSKLEADYDMDDASRAAISKKIAGMSDEDYAAYEMDLKALMKEKSKVYKQTLTEKLKASLEDASCPKTKEEDENLTFKGNSVEDSHFPEPKLSTRQHTDVYKAKKKKEYEAAKKKLEEEYEASCKEEDEEEAEAHLAFASAKNNVIDKDFDNQMGVHNKSMKERMKEAFGAEITIGKETLNDLNEKRKQKLK